MTDTPTYLGDNYFWDESLIAGSKSEWWKAFFRKPEGSVTIVVYDANHPSGSCHYSTELLYQAFKSRYEWELEHGE